MPYTHGYTASSFGMPIALIWQMGQTHRSLKKVINGTGKLGQMRQWFIGSWFMEIGIVGQATDMHARLQTHAHSA